MNNWLEITISGNDLEEKCSLLFEYGICGTSLESLNRAKCFLQTNDENLSRELLEQLDQLNLKIENIISINNTNWIQNCSDLFETVDVGNLRIVPLRSAEDKLTKSFDNKRDILIIPGTGFGTGHHATTFNLLKLLQHPDIINIKPEEVLDAGTGSGILAIAASRLYDCKVDAYEVDPLAVENASENIELNELTNSINIFCESVHLAEKQYKLVIANLYAELLIMLCSHLTSRGEDKAYYLLSGIKSELADGVIEKYNAHGLNCIEKIESDGWIALLLKRG